MENNVKINRNYLVFHLILFGIFSSVKLIESTVFGKCSFLILLSKQECIPVGCVPSVVVAISGEGSAQGGVCLGGVCLVIVHPPANRMTGRQV